MENIIAKSKAPSSNEAFVEVTQSDGKLKAAWAKPSIFSFFQGARYVVRRTFEPPQLVICGATKILNAENGEEIELRPRLTVQRVADDGILTAAVAFHPHYDHQEAFLERLTGDIIRRFVIESEGNPMAALLEPVRNRSWDYKLAEELRKQTGLEVVVQLLADEAAQSWGESLRALPSRYLPMTFQPLAMPRAYSLRVSFRVTCVSLRYWNILCARARAKIAPDDEMTAIGKRIEQILDPVVTGFQPSVLMNNHSGFWNHVEATFSEGVSVRIAEEFGCIVRLADLKRDKTSLESDLDAKEDPEAVNRVTSMMKLVGEARDHHAALLRASGFDPDAESVKKAARAIETLEGQLANLKKQINHDKQLTAVRHLPGDEALTELSNAVEHARRSLRVPAKDGDTTWLLKDTATDQEPSDERRV